MSSARKLGRYARLAKGAVRIVIWIMRNSRQQDEQKPRKSAVTAQQLIVFLNRCDLIDSDNSLDGVSPRLDNRFMTDASDTAAEKVQMLVLERREPSRNMARFYVLAIEPAFLGDIALVREWGRIGFPGRRRLDLHPDTTSAAEALDVWLERKTRRGYRVRASRPTP